jgi:hypothetical protein
MMKDKRRGGVGVGRRHGGIKAGVVGVQGVDGRRAGNEVVEGAMAAMARRRWWSKAETSRWVWRLLY